MTIAQLCKQKGYATAIYGKWHLGDARKFLPLQHGFDEYFGLPYSNDMTPHRYPGEERKTMKLPLINQNTVVNPDVDDPAQDMLTTWYTEHAVSFIRRHKSVPFFLYVPHAMVHVPLHVSDKYRGKTTRGLFGDVVEEVDWSVGRNPRGHQGNRAGREHAGDVLLRQRPLALLRRRCRLGLSAPRGQGH